MHVDHVQGKSLFEQIFVIFETGDKAKKLERECKLERRNYIGREGETKLENKKTRKLLQVEIQHNSRI